MSEPWKGSSLPSGSTEEGDSREAGDSVSPLGITSPQYAGWTRSKTRQRLASPEVVTVSGLSFGSSGTFVRRSSKNLEYPEWFSKHLHEITSKDKLLKAAEYGQTLLKELEALRADLEDLESENMRMQAVLQDWSHEKTVVRNKHRQALDEVQSIREANLQLEAQVVELTKSRDTLHRQLETARQTNSQLQEELLQCAEVENSLRNEVESRGSLIQELRARVPGQQLLDTSFQSENVSESGLSVTDSKDGSRTPRRLSSLRSSANEEELLLPLEMQAALESERKHLEEAERELLTLRRHVTDLLIIDGSRFDTFDALRDAVMDRLQVLTYDIEDSDTADLPTEDTLIVKELTKIFQRKELRSAGQQTIVTSLRLGAEIQSDVGVRSPAIQPVNRSTGGAGGGVSTGVSADLAETGVGHEQKPSERSIANMEGKSVGCQTEQVHVSRAGAFEGKEGMEPQQGDIPARSGMAVAGGAGAGMPMTGRAKEGDEVVVPPPPRPPQSALAEYLRMVIEEYLAGTAISAELQDLQRIIVSEFSGLPDSVVGTEPLRWDEGSGSEEEEDSSSWSTDEEAPPDWVGPPRRQHEAFPSPVKTASPSVVFEEEEDGLFVGFLSKILNKPKRWRSLAPPIYKRLGVKCGDLQAVFVDLVKRMEPRNTIAAERLFRLKRRQATSASAGSSEVELTAMTSKVAEPSPNHDVATSPKKKAEAPKKGYAFSLNGTGIPRSVIPSPAFHTPGPRVMALLTTISAFLRATACVDADALFVTLSKQAAGREEWEGWMQEHAGVRVKQRHDKAAVGRQRNGEEGKVGEPLPLQQVFEARAVAFMKASVSQLLRQWVRVVNAVAGMATGKGPTPLQWVADSSAQACKLCHSPFSGLRRRHHCRACGDVFCSKCSNKKLDFSRGVIGRVAQPGDPASVRATRKRVCNECFIVLRWLPGGPKVK